IHPPSGCRFHPRCPYRFEPCDKEEPPFIEVEPGHYVRCHLFAKR
ncbi:MAG: ABC transporter ATP-binding protein, partial [Candidatus Korarchaeota archaeon]|nr:ABC transporter ATP-binding protein [Candidatus Korarchaeota archaeon]